MDYISRTESLHTEADGYAVFYPNDGFLSSTYFYLLDAQQQRDNLADVFPDAYVVRVRIERV